MNKTIEKLIPSVLSAAIIVSGCSSTVGLAKAGNSLDIARANAQQTIAAHPNWIPNGATIGKTEMFYDPTGKVVLYEFILVKGSGDVGSIIGNADTGSTSGGSMSKSMTYQLDKYFSDVLWQVVPIQKLGVLEKRRLFSGQLGASWGLKFKNQPTRLEADYLADCAMPLPEGWFEFRQGANPDCELVLDSKPEPLSPH